MTDPRWSFVGSVSPTDRDEEALRSLLADTWIRILVADEAISTFAGQILALQLATLLIRLFDRIELAGDEAAAPAAGVPLLTDARYLAGLRTLLPTLRPLPVAHHPAAGSAFTVVVGRGGALAEQGELFIGATAWGARISTTAPQSVANTRTPVGALAAGALGASEAFKRVFDGQMSDVYSVPDYSVSLLDYQPSGAPEDELPEHIELDATLFGCGSVGCALLLGLLCVSQLHGKLVVVDNGRFDLRNPYKYTLLDWDSAQQQWFKAAWAQRRMSECVDDRLRVLAFVGTADEYVASLPVEYRIPVAISAVDTPDARMETQDTLPRQIINAGVDGTQVEVSVHGFGGDGPCLACLQLDAQLAAWNGKAIADATGLAPTRVQELLGRNLGMSQEDVDVLKMHAQPGAREDTDLDSYVGQPLLSYWRRVAYSEAILQPTIAQAPARVTTAFVSAYAGVLLLAELLKASVPELASFRVDNSYRQQLLGVPTHDVFRHPRDQRGWCLCHSNFRQLVYRDKYGLLE